VEGNTGGRPRSGDDDNEPDDDGFHALLDRHHPSWNFLRTLSVDQLATRVSSINKQKYMRDPRFAKFLERGLRVASARCLMGDDDATSDAHRLTMLLVTLLFNKHRPLMAGAPNSPWLDIVRARTARLWGGDFEGLFREAHVQSARPSPEMSPMSAAEARERAVNRAVDFGLNGSLSRSLRALTGKGNLPLSEEKVQDKFIQLLNPNNEERPKEWREFVSSAPECRPPTDPCYGFELGRSVVPGPNGDGMEVDTLEWVLSHLDATTSPGISGMGYDMLKHVKPGVLRPLLAAFFGQGSWNYEKFVETGGQRSYYQIDTHALMISVVGVALNKDGKPFVRSEPVDNLRPICIGESIRRIAARCQLLQCEKSVGEKLAENGQYGMWLRPWNCNSVPHNLQVPRCAHRGGGALRSLRQ
jgi:hypothetical protein